MVRKAIGPGPIAFVFALTAAALMLAGGRDFCLDDAWIHLAYAKSLRLGDGLSYNPGDHATGFSSPLWVWLIAIVPWGADPVVPVKLLGALCHAATAWGAASLTEVVVAQRSVPAARLGASIAGVTCALDPALTFASVSGMEVPLTAALLVWTVRVGFAGNLGVSCALAAAAVWARPESLFFLGAWSLLRLMATRSLRSVAPLAAAGAALLLWMLYCSSVSGYPFPNTYYAKRNANFVLGLLYFGAEYLPTHAWVLGVSGLVFVGLALAHPGEPRRIALAWLIASGAIAGSRELIPHVLFYCWRYFAVLAVFPCVAFVSALPERRILALTMVAPILLATAWMLPGAHALQRAQEHDIRLVHREPAQWLARTLPSDSRVLVEGAGATRFFLPRSVQVIDAVGLNLASVVHTTEPRARVCAALKPGPTHVFLPAPLYAAFEQVLDLAAMRDFVDPEYRIGSAPRVERVIAARVIRIKPVVRRVCGLP